MPKPVDSELPESKVIADPKLEKRTRRAHSVDYKLRIIAEADACKYGELGQLLRHEGLYSAQVKQWRQELASNDAQRLSKTRPGPTAKLSADQRQIEKLQTEVKRLSRELQISNGCLELQKKALQILDLQSNGNKP